jgi:hypothetical protein
MKIIRIEVDLTYDRLKLNLQNEIRIDPAFADDDVSVG